MAKRPKSVEGIGGGSAPDLPAHTSASNRAVGVRSAPPPSSVTSLGSAAITSPIRSTLVEREVTIYPVFEHELETVGESNGRFAWYIGVGSFFLGNAINFWIAGAFAAEALSAAADFIFRYGTGGSCILAAVFGLLAWREHRARDRGLGKIKKSKTEAHLVAEIKTLDPNRK